jgi:M6 family metalloprotease-like protein
VRQPPRFRAAYWQGLLAGGLAVTWPGASAPLAQDRPVERLRTADGVRLDYPPDGVWRARARSVAEVRARLRAGRRMIELNAPAASRAGSAAEAAVSGTLRFPTVLLTFRDLDSTQVRGAASYDSVIYGRQSVDGRPYTMRTLYEEMSNGLLTLDGRAYGWVASDSAMSYYLDACGSTRNAIDCSTGRTRMHQLFVTALARADQTVDFGQFDNDGPDGIPNSGDDDGIVDVVQFVHPIRGGECRGRGYWAHKSSLANWGGFYRTQDANPQGSGIFVNAYYIVSGVGGTTCSDGTIMGIGTASHELGHGLGLPDLYDTFGDGEGVGEWGLMGSGGYTSLLSPAHLEAWSKERLGWVTVREIAPGQSYRLGPVVTADTVFLIRPTGPNPRGEYFLLENKQALGSDTSNLQTGGRAGPKLGGLLVWHVDSAKVAESLSFNRVNAGDPKGVRLIQADNAADLEQHVNRGDAGDPFPGSAGQTAFAGGTAPANVNNAEGGFTGFGVHRVRQITTGGPMAFYLAPEWIARPSGGTGATVRVDGIPYARFHDAPDSGSVYTVSVDPRQETYWWQYEFVGWSDGGAPTHQVVTGIVRDSLIAEVKEFYKVEVSVVGSGRVEATPSVPLKPGVFHAKGTELTLIARPEPGQVFARWDRAVVPLDADTGMVTVDQPHDLTAVFAPAVFVQAPSVVSATWGASLALLFQASGGVGQFYWQLVSGKLPSGLAFTFDGRLSGTPRQLGSFPITVSVTSGFVTVPAALVITVEPPAVEFAAALAQLFSPDSLLTTAARAYLDFLGNQNGDYDLGDLAALADRLPGTPASAPGIQPPPAVPSTPESR